MAKIVWTDDALSDLNDILDFLSKTSPAYAQRVVSRMADRVEILESHVKVGRMVPEKNNENIRELIESNCRIIYRIQIGDAVEILRIHNSHRPLINM